MKLHGCYWAQHLYSWTRYLTAILLRETSPKQTPVPISSIAKSVCSFLFSQRLHHYRICITLLRQSNIQKLNPVHFVHRFCDGTLHNEHAQRYKRKKIQLFAFMGYCQCWSYTYILNLFKVLVLGAYTKSIALMSFAQIVLGFGGYSTMIIGYAIISDMCKDTMRQKAILSMNGVW